MIPTKQRGISVFDEIVLTTIKLPKEVAMEIIIMGCWSTWLVRNDKIFRSAPPHVNSWKFYLKEGLQTVRLRAKNHKATQIDSWIELNL